MNPLEKIVHSKYKNANQILKLVGQKDLLQKVSKAIANVEKKIANGKIADLSRISPLILKDINETLSQISNKEDKREIESILSSLFNDYFEIIAAQENGQQILTELINNLKETSEYYNYDFNELDKILNLRSRLYLIPNQTTKSIYYEWKGRDNEIQAIAHDLVSSKTIYSTKEFIRLFKPVEGNLQIRCNPDHRDRLLILFQVLKEDKLISSRGNGNSGHFSPFVKYARDNNGIFLFEKAANKEHAQLKKNMSKYIDLTKKMRDLVNSNLKRN